ncbi:hypothetical protein BKA82DRAFT_4013246 [Pisolithus tinctorius]|nr:hypothetical protein BKA82DRAFT_4013246 [Pisolithus tinctorius]
MDSPYDADDGYDDWVPTDVEDGSNIFRQGTEQSVTGDGDQENFDINELEVLVRRRKDWKESGKTKKPMILQSILGELHELDKNTELSHAEMQLKAGLVTAWLKKPLRARKPQITLRSGYRYSVRSVVRELYHDLVQRKLASMREDTGNEESTKQIGVYQQALTAFMQEDLSEEQLAAAEAIADKWNGMEGPTPEIKARNAARYGYKYCRNFAEEMWRYCGMRVVCFAGWKNVEGTVEACTMDFNRDIADGTSFNEHLRSLEFQTKTEDGQGDGRPGKKAARTVKVDAVSLVTNEDGTVSIGEIAGLSRDLLQKTVRGFMTAHYRRACGKATSTVPFKQLGTHQKAMIATRHLPPNFSFTVDPSHMSVAAATELLSFWRQRQDEEHGRCPAHLQLLPPNPKPQLGGLKGQIGGEMERAARTQCSQMSKAVTWMTLNRASPVVFEGADMPGPSHDRHGRVSNGGKSSHLKRLHRRKIAADVETDHDDDPLDDGWPQANQRHEATPFPRKTTAPIRPDDAHRKDTRRVQQTNYQHLPNGGQIKDGSEHQGDDHLRSLPIAQDAPPNPVGRGNKRPEVRLKPSLKQGGQARINPGRAKQDVAQPHSATASKGHRIPLRNGQGYGFQIRTEAIGGERWRWNDGGHLEIPSGPSGPCPAGCGYPFTPIQAIAEAYIGRSRGFSRKEGKDAMISDGVWICICWYFYWITCQAASIYLSYWARKHDILNSRLVADVPTVGIHPLWPKTFPTEYSFNPGVRIRQIEARGEDPLQSAGPSRRGQKAGTIRQLTSHGRHSQMPEHLPPQPRLSEVSTSMDDIPPPPPPPEDDIPPPPPPPNDLEVAAEEVPPPQPSEASDDSEEQTPPPQSDEDETDNALIPPPPPSSQGSDSHHSVTSPDGNDTPMDTDITLELPAQPPSDDISNPQVPILEDQPDVLFRAERHRLQQKFTRLCSAWMGHDLSDEEKREMEVHGFVRPGADHAIYWAVHQLRLTRRPVRYHFPFHPNDQFDPAVADAMARTATDFAYVVLRRMDLREEAERSLRQIADLDTFYDPFAAIGLQRFAAQPRYLARQSVMDMIFMYMSCRIDTAVRHLVQLPTVATWPAHWYRNLCIDMSTLDCLIPIAVTQNCYRLPFPTSYMLQHMGGWTEETFRNALSRVPEAQMSDTCSHVMELLPQWTPHLQEDGGFVLPWWLTAASNYASNSRSFDLWPSDKSPIKDRLHGTLESRVESYMNIARRVEALLPDLNAEVEELFERLTCMAQMLGLYTDGARCELCTCVE